MKKTVLLITSIVTLAASCTFEKYEVPVKPAASSSACDTIVHYSWTIAPLISANCGNGCHDATGTQSDLTNYAILQGDVTNVLDRVLGNGNIMPTSGPLPAADISKLKCWISQGAQNN